MHDTLIRGAGAGALGTVVQAALNWTWMLAGLAPDTLTHLLARTLFIVPPTARPAAGELVVALFTQVLVGSLYGLGLALVLGASGHRWALAKGWGAGTLLGTIHLAVVPFLARVPARVPLPLALLHIADHMVWGVLTAYLIVRFRPRVGLAGP